MGLTHTEMDLATVGVELNNRLDQELYLARARFQEYAQVFEASTLLGNLIDEIRNGENISKDHYSHEMNTGVLYLSVNQIVGGLGKTLRLDDATYLDLDPDDLDVVVSPGDVVLTRSGTPGVAWTATEEFLQQWDALVPSGYTMVLKVREEEIEPDFLAAYLNSPPVRMLTKAAACGKDQANISQEYVKAIPVPVLTAKERTEFVANIDKFHAEIQKAQSLVRHLLNQRDHYAVDFLEGERQTGFDFPEIQWSPSAISETGQDLENWRLPKRRQSD